MLYIDHPFHFDGAGLTAQTTWSDHVLDMICQFLLTQISERVNRPDFGTPLSRSCFAPNSKELVDVTQFLARAGLQRWLGDAIEIIELAALAEGAVLTLDLKYRIRGEQVVRLDQRRLPLPGGVAP
jgi:phage baseplate assembly protein W